MTDVIWPILQILFILIVFGAILFLVSVTTRYIGAKAQKAMQGKYITIIETVNLGTDKRLHLIKAGDEFILLAASGKSIEFLTTLNLEEYQPLESSSNIAPMFDFKSLYEKSIKAYKAIKREKVENHDTKQEENEKELTKKDTSFRSNLERLRNMTSFMDSTGKMNKDDHTNEKQ